MTILKLHFPMQHGPERWVPAHKISCGESFRYECLLCGAVLSVLEDQRKVTSTVPSQADNLVADLALPLAPMSKSPVSTNFSSHHLVKDADST